MKYRFALVVVMLVGLCLGVLAQDDVPGRIAYVGPDHNIYTIDLQEQEPAALTTDASQLRRYEWPTWSRDNQLAYFCCAFRSEAEVFVSSDGIEPGQTVYQSSEESVSYAAWSPEDCSTGRNCRDLAVLLSQRQGFFNVEVIRTTDLDNSSRTIGNGSPFYFSWSPDGEQMVWQRDNRRMDIYDVGAGETDKLQEFPGFMQAPDWSPVDDRLLFGRLNNEAESTDLVIIADDDESSTLLEDIDGLLSFNWSPSGEYVAYRVASENGIGPVEVMDAETGDIVAQSALEDVFGFFWSPDSSKIAFVTLDTPTDSFSASAGSAFIDNTFAQQQESDVALAWGVLDVEAEETRRYPNFLPTREFVYMINYFDQFAQSHQVWSPDSTHITYSATTETGQPAINVLDVTREDSVPLAVAEGSIAIWSYR